MMIGPLDVSRSSSAKVIPSSEVSFKWRRIRSTTSRHGLAHGGPVRRTGYAQVIIIEIIRDHLAQVRIVIDYQNVSGNPHAGQRVDNVCNPQERAGSV